MLLWPTRRADFRRNVAVAHTPCTFCWRLNTTFVGAVERLLCMISVCSFSILLIRAWCFRFVMLSSRRGVVVQNLICLVLKFSDGRPSEKHPATAVDTPGSARRGEGGERDLRDLNSWAGNRGGGFVSIKGFHKMRDRGAATTERPVVIVLIIYNMAAEQKLS